MINTEYIDVGDFYLNGKWLSTLEGFVAGTNGIEKYTVRPSMEIKTDKIIGVDGELPQSAYYNPRTFSLPLCFDNTNRIREISKWLDIKTPIDFYFKDDKIKIKVMIDSAIDITPYLLARGITDIKFIAYDPYFYAIDDIKYVVTKFNRTFSQVNPLQLYNAVSIEVVDQYTPASYELININNSTNTLQDVINNDYTLYTDGIVTKNENVINMEITNFSSFEIFNDGNKESYPIITITMTDTTKGNATITINGQAMTINNVKNYITIDTKFMTAIGDEEVTDSQNNTVVFYDQNRITDVVGNFVTLQDGINTIGITGNVNKVEIQCRSRWI